MFHTLFRDRQGEAVEVYVNPSEKEMRTIAQEGWVRFIADSRDKKFYAWGGLSEMHGIAWMRIRKPSDFRWAIDKTLLAGSARKRDTIFEMTESSTLKLGSSEIVKAIEKRDWSWVKKYIDIRKFIEGELG